jgi:PKD repeat protein
VTDPGFDNPLNPAGEVSEQFTFAIDWGDGTDLDTGLVTIDVFGSAGVPTQGSFDGSHIYADNGVYTVTVTVSDDDGGTVNKTFTVTVNNVAPNLIVAPDQVVDEGSLLSVTNIGQFTDPGFDNPLNEGGETTETFTYSIDWGDGTPPDMGVATIDVLGGPGVLTAGSFDGSHIYADNGVYTVTITVMDDDGGVASDTLTVIVNNVAPTLVVPGDQMVDAGSLLSLPDIGQFTDPGFDNPLNPEGEVTEQFTFAIDWGDGTPVDSGPGTIDMFGSPGMLTKGSFDGSHVYASDGVYTVTVTVSDDDGGTTSDAFLVTVKSAAPILITAPDQTINEGALLSVTDIGQFIDPRAGGSESYSFTIQWGDGLPNSSGPATIDSQGEGPTTGSFNGAHIYADNGLYTVTVTVTTADGRSATETLLVTVHNVAPTLVVPGNQSVALGSTLSITDIGQFTDPGFDNPLNAEGETTERFTFAVNWGDALFISSGPGAIDTPGMNGVLTAGSFDAQHIFGAPGTFTVTVTVSDDDGGSASGQFTVVVFVIRDSPPSLFIPPGGGGGPATPRPPGFADPGVPPGAPPGLARFEFRRIGGGSVAGAEPRLVLRIVTPVGIEDKSHDEPLADDVLDNLRKLFRRLPDGHYRIYQIQPDGIERLVVDVIVRQGRNIDVADEVQGTGETAPRGDAAPKADAAPQGDEPKQPAPQSAPPQDGAEHAPNPDESADLSTAALAFGVGMMGSAAPLRRRRWGRSARRAETSPLSKVGRLLRRLR